MLHYMQARTIYSLLNRRRWRYVREAGSKRDCCRPGNYILGGGNSPPDRVHS